jgi:nitrate/nitrite transport system ATP-binding protein
VLLCANREIAGPGPERAVVFQNHSLLPWLTCFENVYLAVERVFGAKARPSSRPAPKPRWPGGPERAAQKRPAKSRAA